MPTPSGQNAHEDENLVVGWTVQGGGQGQAAATGVAGSNYAQAGNVAATAALTTTGQAGAGVPNPPLAFDVSGEASASFGESILTNAGYGDVSPSIMTAGNQLPPAVVPVPASATAFQNPFTLPCTVVIAGGTLTEVAINGTSAGTTDGTYSVPSGGSITLTYSVAPTWTWTTASPDGAV